MTYSFSLFVSVIQVRLYFHLWFCICITVRIMPLKAFNVPVCVSLLPEGEAPKCPPPTLNFLPSVRARDSWNSWDTGAWSHPNQSVERVQRVHHQLVPPQGRATHRNRQLSEAMTQSQRGVTSPQSSDNGHLTNGDKMALASPSELHGVMVISCWVNSSPRITSRNLLLSPCVTFGCITFTFSQQDNTTSLCDLAFLSFSEPQETSGQWKLTQIPTLWLRLLLWAVREAPQWPGPIDVISGSPSPVHNTHYSIVTHVWLPWDRRAGASLNNTLLHFTSCTIVHW